MLKNYFKLAIKVLGRKKFFTFVSLFGISFTLMILMLITAFLETELGNNAPMTDKEKMVFVPHLSIKQMRIDTVITIDTSYEGSTMLVDTSYAYPERQQSHSQSGISYYFMDKYLREIEGAEDYSLLYMDTSFDFFLNSKKVTFRALLTDERFWGIYDFSFVEGHAYRKNQLDNQEQVAILTQKACREYFGKDKGIIGQEVVFEKRTYTVIGVIKDTENHRSFVNAEVYLPITTLAPSVLDSKDLMGSGEVVYVGSKPEDVKKIKASLAQQSAIFDEYTGEYVNYNRLELPSLTFAERYADNIYDESDDPAKNLATVKWTLLSLLILFIILPVLNLVNLNVSRIMERSSEIGVRKAFGAHSGNILFQFVFENVILTFIGGVIGFFLALALLYMINESNVLYDTTLSFNYKVFIYSFLICLAFGILSGLLPAYKMSKVHIVNALKQNQR